MKRKFKKLLLMIIVGIILLSPRSATTVSADVLHGDVDSSGTIDASDALLVLKYSVKLVDLRLEQLIRADVTADNEVDPSDALMILKYTVNLIDKFESTPETPIPTETPESPASRSSFVLKNKLSQEYGYYSSRLVPYTKCKVNSVDYTITDSYNGKIEIDVTFLFEKTYQNYEQYLSNLKMRYTLYRGDIAVKTGNITVIGTEMGVQYEEALSFYHLDEGDYTLELKSYY